MTKAAEWLDKVFYGFDYRAARAAFSLYGHGGAFWNKLMSFVSFLGTSGILFIAGGLVLLCFAKTRKLGLCVLVAVFLGAVVTNLLIKPLVARPRPYTHGAYFKYWVQVGMHTESDHSFPSGHTTATTAAMVAVFLSCRKKWSWTALLFALLMGFSRVYLMVHYASDVLFGFIIGAGGGVGAYFLVRLLYRKAGGKFKALLDEWSVVSLFRRKEKPSEGDAGDDTESGTVDNAGSGAEDEASIVAGDGAQNNAIDGAAQE